MADAHTSDSFRRHLNLRSVLLCLSVLAVAAADVTCPRECQCDADGTIRCSGVSGLRELDKSQPIARLVLSGLDLAKIPASLENVRNISELDLSSNRLPGLMHLGKRIRKLDLSHNRITSGKLARLPLVVESLNLTHNEITHLPLSFMKLKKLRYIELANNPINCTCETLHVRNWLTSRHVWSDEHIKCMAPAAFKGRPWLQVRQSDVCHPTVAEERKGGYNWDDYEDDNELMLGDQAHPVQEPDEEQLDDLRREYLPVGEKVKRQEPPIVVENDEEADAEEASGGGPLLGESGIGAEAVRAKVVDESLAEASGDDFSVPRAVVHEEEHKSGEEREAEADEASGSGGGVLFFPDDRAVWSSSTEEPLEEKPLDPIGPLNIFEHDLSTPEPEQTSAVDRDEQHARVLHTSTAAPDGDVEAPLVVAETSDKTVTASTEHDNQNTYILLSILGIIVVSLIVMVVCKRKPDSRNRRGKYDVEASNQQGRELKEMNRNLLDKAPADRNGHGGTGGNPEQAPLMAKNDYERVFGDPKKTAFSPVKPQRASLEKPLETFKPVPAERNGGRLPEPDNNNTTALPNGNGALHNGEPPAACHKSPVADVTDSDGHLLAEPPMESPRAKRYSPIYVPTSPKSDRYSPVYSPETGRVKIKLTETPKPKTPILVTRSRSRAGEIITTMDDQKF